MRNQRMRIWSKIRILLFRIFRESWVIRILLFRIFSGILGHSQSFIPHFLNSRLHFFQYISFLSMKFDTPSVKLPSGNEANQK